MNMYFSFSLVFLFLSQLSAVSAAEAESCACEAEHLGFEINCEDTAAMLTAFNAIQSSSCATDCTSADCELNYYIVQAHHDYCLDSEVPTEVEAGFHDFDNSCVPCAIQRRVVEGASNCPEAVCDDGSGNAAYSAMVEAGCLSDCSLDDCVDLFFTLVAVHDNCPSDALNQVAAAGLHDLEEVCTMHVCNSATGANQPVCDDDHGHEGADEAAASSGAKGLEAVAAAFVLLSAMAVL